MKGFKLDKNGDVVIERGQIQMVSGDELMAQTCRTVLSTNKGEWFSDQDEGINFSNLLGKKKTDEIIRDEIQSGLSQVDEDIALSAIEIKTRMDEGRRMDIDFTAQKAGTTISSTASYEV